MARSSEGALSVSSSVSVVDIEKVQARPWTTAAAACRSHCTARAESSLTHLGPFLRSSSPEPPQSSARQRLVSRMDASLSAPESWPSACAVAPASLRAAASPAWSAGSVPPPAAPTAAVAPARTPRRGAVPDHTPRRAPAGPGTLRTKTSDTSPPPRAPSPLSGQSVGRVIKVGSSTALETEGSE